MSLVRALMPACLALSITIGTALRTQPVRAEGIVGTGGPTIVIPAPGDAFQVRSVRVLAALLVALTATGPQGFAAPPGRIAEAERLLADKLLQEASGRRAPSGSLPFLRRVALSSGSDKYSTGEIQESSADIGRTTRSLAESHENGQGNATNYNTFHTFSGDRTIFAPPTPQAFAAPCDGKIRFGWPCAEAPEMPRVQLTRRVGEGERPKLSDGLHRRRWEVIPDVTLGQNAHPSTDRMNLNGFARTNGPTLDIAER